MCQQTVHANTGERAYVRQGDCKVCPCVRLTFWHMHTTFFNPPQAIFANALIFFKISTVEESSFQMKHAKNYRINFFVCKGHNP